jgi:hypothetical protein
VWEHSYYIDYRNLRPKYLEAFVDNLINWDYVLEMYEAARDDPQGDRRNVQIIALAGAVTPEIKRASIGAGIDEIIVKPMSPKYLLERVLSRLQRQAPRALRPLPARSSPSRIDLARAGSNVIPLFGRRLEPTH